MSKSEYYTKFAENEILDAQNVQLSNQPQLSDISRSKYLITNAEGKTIYIPGYKLLGYASKNDVPQDLKNNLPTTHSAYVHAENYLRVLGIKNDDIKIILNHGVNNIATTVMSANNVIVQNGFKDDSANNQNEKSGVIHIKRGIDDNVTLTTYASYVGFQDKNKKIDVLQEINLDEVKKNGGKMSKGVNYCYHTNFEPKGLTEKLKSKANYSNLYQQLEKLLANTSISDKNQATEIVKSTSTLIQLQFEGAYQKQTGNGTENAPHITGPILTSLITQYLEAKSQTSKKVEDINAKLKSITTHIKEKVEAPDLSRSLNAKASFENFNSLLKDDITKQMQQKEGQNKDNKLTITNDYNYYEIQHNKANFETMKSTVSSVSSLYNQIFTIKDKQGKETAFNLQSAYHENADIKAPLIDDHNIVKENIKKLLQEKLKLNDEKAEVLLENIELYKSGMNSFASATKIFGPVREIGIQNVGNINKISYNKPTTQDGKIDIILDSQGSVDKLVSTHKYSTVDDTGQETGNIVKFQNIFDLNVTEKDKSIIQTKIKLDDKKHKEVYGDLIPRDNFYKDKDVGFVARDKTLSQEFSGNTTQVNIDHLVVKEAKDLEQIYKDEKDRQNNVLDQLKKLEALEDKGLSAYQIIDAYADSYKNFETVNKKIDGKTPREDYSTKQLAEKIKELETRKDMVVKEKLEQKQEFEERVAREKQEKAKQEQERINREKLDQEKKEKEQVENLIKELSKIVEDNHKKDIGSIAELFKNKIQAFNLSLEQNSDSAKSLNLEDKDYKGLARQCVDLYQYGKEKDRKTGVINAIKNWIYEKVLGKKRTYEFDIKLEDQEKLSNVITELKGNVKKIHQESKTQGSADSRKRGGVVKELKH